MFVVRIFGEFGPHINSRAAGVVLGVIAYLGRRILLYGMDAWWDPESIITESCRVWYERFHRELGAKTKESVCFAVDLHLPS